MRAFILVIVEAMKAASLQRVGHLRRRRDAFGCLSRSGSGVRVVDEADVRWGSLGHSLASGDAIYRWPRRQHAAINPPIGTFASLMAASASNRRRTLPWAQWWCISVTG